MTKITRATQVIFGQTGLVPTGGFGAPAAGDLATEVATSSSLSTIMGTPAWLQGWLDATLGSSKFPTIEDMNSAFYAISTQLGYLFQQGIPEYDAGTTYYINSLCTNPGTAQIYISLINANTGNALSNASDWQLAFDFGNVPTSAQCRLIYSAGNLLLEPYNGNQLTINGSKQTIPSAGVTLAPSGLTPATLYYIYAAMSGSSMVLNASTTGYVVSSTNGLPVKSGDATQTLVGMAYIDTGPAFADSIGKRYTRSYFNRRATPIGSPTPLSGQTTTSMTPAELLTAARAGFVCFGDENVSINAGVIASVNNAGSSANINIGINNITPQGFAGQIYSAASGESAGMNALVNGFQTEGYNFATLLGSVSANTGTFSSGGLTGVIGG